MELLNKKDLNSRLSPKLVPTCFQNELSTMTSRLDELLRKMKTLEEDLKNSLESQEETAKLVESIAKSAGIEMDEQPYKRKPK